MRAPFVSRGGTVCAPTDESASPGSPSGFLVALMFYQDWVLSALTFFVIVPFNPWQLILLWFCIVFLGNMVFFFVLRYNQVRLTSILTRLGG